MAEQTSGAPTPTTGTSSPQQVASQTDPDPPPLISESEIKQQAPKAEPGRTPAQQAQPQPTEPATSKQPPQQGHNFDAGLQALQRRVADQDRQMAEQSGKMDALLDQVTATVVALQQQPQPQSPHQIVRDPQPAQQTAAPQVDPKRLVEQAYQGLDPLDEVQGRQGLERLVSSLTTQLASAGPQFDQAQLSATIEQSVQQALQPIQQQVQDLGGRMQESATTTYWQQYKARNQLTDPQFDAAMQQARTTVQERFGYDQQSPSYSGAVVSELHHVVEALKSQGGPPPAGTPALTAPAQPASAPAQSTDGTEVLPTGASANTTPPADPDEVPITRDEDVWSSQAGP